MATLTFDGLNGLLKRLGIEADVPKLSSLDPLANPLDVYRSCLAKHISDSLGVSLPSVLLAFQSRGDPVLQDIALAIPRLGQHFDYEKLRIKNGPLSLLFAVPYVESASLRYFFGQRYFPGLIIPYITDRNVSYGRIPSRDGGIAGRVIVEFSSPNIPDGLSDKSYRSTIIGSCIANLYTFLGWDVIKLNHVGDWGKRFSLLAVAWERYGSEQAFKQGPLSHLRDILAIINEDFAPELTAQREAMGDDAKILKIQKHGIHAQRNAFNQRLEKLDQSATLLVQRFREAALQEYEADYRSFGITFDEYSGESEAARCPGLLDEIENTLRTKQVCEYHNGTWLINFDNHGLKGLGTALLRAADGSTTFLLRDLAAAIFRERKFHFDRMIYVASNDMALHYRRLFAALRLMGLNCTVQKLQHVGFGRIHNHPDVFDGTTSLGTVLANSIAMVRESNLEEDYKSEQLEPDASFSKGITVLIEQDLTSKRAKGYRFDLAKTFNRKLSRRPELWGAYCVVKRSLLVSKEWKANATSQHTYYNEPLKAPDHYQRDEFIDVMRLLVHFPSVVGEVYKTLEFAKLLSYIYEVAWAVHELFDESLAEDDGPSIDDVHYVRCRDTVSRCVLPVMENTFQILGLPLLDDNERLLMPQLDEAPMTSAISGNPSFPRLDQVEGTPPPYSEPIGERRASNDIDDIDDIESVQSTIFSCASIQSSKSSCDDDSILAVLELATFLMCDEELVALISTAYEKVGQIRFQRNMARFLAKFSRNLLREACTDLQHQAAGFVRRYAQHAAMQMGKDLGAPKAPTAPTHPATVALDDGNAKSSQLNQWIESQVWFQDRKLQGTVEIDEREAEIAWKPNDGIDDVSDSELSEDLQQDSLQSLDEVKGFLRSANALVTLRNEMRHWLKLGVVERQSMAASDEEYVIETKPSYEGRLSDIIKKSMERCAGTRLSWAPWSNPVYEQGSNRIRVYTMLQRGQQVYEDVPITLAESIFPKLKDPLLPHSRIVIRLSGTSLLSLVAGRSSKTVATAAPLTQTELKTSRDQSAASAMRENIATRSNIRNTSEPNNSPLQPANKDKKSALFLSADVGPNASRAKQVDIGSDDKKTLVNLRQAYGSLCLGWLSWKRATGVKFYKFDSFLYKSSENVHCISIHRDKERYPIASDPEYPEYSYQPRPWPSDQFYPSNEVWHYFSHPSDCGTSDALNRVLPVRVKGTLDSHARAFGIYIEERYSVWAIFLPACVAIGITLAATLWFVPQWLSTHPDDLQGATVPTMLVSSVLGSLFQAFFSLLVFRWTHS
ncbi:arginyl-trna synthetase [Apiospora arundinis]|uniref:arginine--tRNA ligase n=1 Tax=Apiospora arundinis TaxID=335852 RepID=A0ABR2HLC6_9PEZI